MNARRPVVLVVREVAVVGDVRAAVLGGGAHQHMVHVAADAQRRQHQGGPVAASRWTRLAAARSVAESAGAIRPEVMFSR